MDENGRFSGLRTGCGIAAGIAVVFLLLVGLTFAADALGIIELNLFGVGTQNARTSVTRCSNEYLSRVEDQISTDLQGIADNDVAIASLKADPANADTVKALKAQETADANDVYSALDSFSCQKSQLYADQGTQLQAFFDRWNGPTGHSDSVYTTVNP